MKQTVLKKQKATLYTPVYHTARKKLGLTLTEYMVADTIAQLSQPANKAGGWCYMSKEHMAVMFDVKVRQIFNIIDTLLTKKLIERDASTKFLRATSLWIENVIEIR